MLFVEVLFLSMAYELFIVLVIHVRLIITDFAVVMLIEQVAFEFLLVIEANAAEFAFRVSWYIAIPKLIMPFQLSDLIQLLLFRKYSSLLQTYITEMQFMVLLHMSLKLHLVHHFGPSAIFLPAVQPSQIFELMLGLSILKNNTVFPYRAHCQVRVLINTPVEVGSNEHLRQLCFANRTGFITKQNPKSGSTA